MSTDNGVVATVVGVGLTGGFTLLGWLTKSLIGGIRADIADVSADVKALTATSGIFDRRLTRLEADRDLESVMARSGRRRRSDERTIDT